MSIFISSQYLLLDKEFSHFCSLLAETVAIVVQKEFIVIQHILDHMECSQPHCFFIILGEDSCGISTVIHSENMIIGSCIPDKIKPEH